MPEEYAPSGKLTKEDWRRQGRDTAIGVGVLVSIQIMAQLKDWVDQNHGEDGEGWAIVAIALVLGIQFVRRFARGLPKVKDIDPDNPLGYGKGQDDIDTEDIPTKDAQ